MYKARNKKVYGGTMLEIKKTDLNQIELLLNQSTKGYHCLFDHKKIAQILKTPTENLDFFTKVNIQLVQELLSSLLSKKSFQQKQSYLNSLNHQKFELLVRTYFHIVDSTVMASLKTPH